MGGFANEATNFHELVDCPLIASDSLKKDTYQVGDTTFYLWFQGEFQPDFEQLKNDFIPFTKKRSITSTALDQIYLKTRNE